MSVKLSTLVLFVVSIFCASVVCAQNSNYAADFLRIPIGSRAEAMGGGFTAIANDQSAFHFNPAGVSLLEHKTLGLMYSSEYGLPGSSLASVWHAGVTLPLKEITLGLNWVRFNISDLEHTPDLTSINITALRQELVRLANGGPKELFSDNEDAYVLSVARNNKINVDWGWLYYEQVIEIPIGVNFKVIHQQIGSFGQSNGIGVDAGAMLKFSLGQFLLLPFLGDISVGTTFYDIGGTRINWSTERTHIVPMRIMGGAAYKQTISDWNSTVTVAGDFELKKREKPRLGLEWNYRDLVALRMGFNHGEFTTGAGLTWRKQITLDYSLALHDLGAIHRLTLQTDLDKLFGKSNEETPKQ